MTPLRLLIHDRTCSGRGVLPGLSDAWRAGGTLYRGLGRLDGVLGVASWNEAFDWLVYSAERAQRPVGEVQFWGHGRRGRALVASESLDVRSLEAGSPHAARMAALRRVLVPRSTLWFRTCETLGGAAGQRFAQEFSAFLGARVAGHTHVIGFWQSGLRTLSPGALPQWAPTEGVGAAGELAPALGSSPRLPRTIHCLQGRIPPGF